MPDTKRADHSQSVKAMVDSDPSAGLFYIRNPNNPTDSVTSKEGIQRLIDNKPKASVFLPDEAYIHCFNAEKGTPWVGQSKDVIVLRTFSKLYSLAGMQLGMAMARPELASKFMPYGPGSFVPVTALVAGTAGVKQQILVSDRARIYAETCGAVFEFLEKRKLAYVPSTTNFFMLETKRPGAELAAAIHEQIQV
ncbi:MAG: aminotransferase class I/II-fold pyridoxal phosphate-dependent enzyme, partial [Bryobacteraceae bacterium]